MYNSLHYCKKKYAQTNQILMNNFMIVSSYLSEGLTTADHVQYLFIGKYIFK